VAPENLVAGELSGFSHVWSAPSTGSPTTTLLLLHGTGGDEYDLLPLGKTIAPGLGLLSPRGRVLENGRVNRFFRRLAEGVYDELDIKQRVGELAEFIQTASLKYAFDPTDVVALGFSNGANIAAAMMLLRPRILRAAVLLSPLLPMEVDEPPNLNGAQVFIGAGLADPIAPRHETDRLAQRLESYGAMVTLDYHPAGHTLTQSEIDAVRIWLQTVIR